MNMNTNRLLPIGYNLMADRDYMTRQAGEVLTVAAYTIIAAPMAVLICLLILQSSYTSLFRWEIL